VANAPGCTSASAAYCTYPALDVPTFTASRLSHPQPASDPGSQSRKYVGEKWPINFAEMPRDLLHAVNQRHRTHGFISLPEEGARRIFSPLKIRRLRLGLNPRTWVPNASALTPRPPYMLVFDIFLLCNNMCFKFQSGMKCTDLHS
jgi:hypothetical protein